MRNSTMGVKREAVHGLATKKPCWMVQPDSRIQAEVEVEVEVEVKRALVGQQNPHIHVVPNSLKHSSSSGRKLSDKPRLVWR